MPRLTEIQLVNLAQPLDIALPEVSYCQQKAAELAAEEILQGVEEIDVSRIVTAVMSQSVSQLRVREQRGLPFYIMKQEFSQHNPEFALAVIESESKTKRFYKALFNAWLKIFPQDKTLGKRIRATLSSNINNLTEPQKKIIDTFKVLEKTPPFKQLSKSILNNTIDRESLELVKFSNGVSATEFAVVLIVELAAYMKRGRFNEQEYEKFIELVAPNEVIHTSNEASALIGIIYPVKERGPNESRVEKARTIIEKNYADPRIGANEWPSIPSILGGQEAQDECIEQVKKWKIFQSITLFFRIMERAIGTENKHQWPERKKLWLQYFDIHAVNDAWVMLGAQADNVARNLRRRGDEEITQLRWGNLSNARDQSVLLLKIDKLTIAEWSHNGACRFWMDSDYQAPKLHRPSYPMERIRTENENNIEKVIHNPRTNWQGKIKRNIRDNVGIRLSLW